MRNDLPAAPGEYAWFKDGIAVYSGVGAGKQGIRQRVWDSHLKTGPDLSRSSFRRNVCEYLGIASVAAARIRPTVFTQDMLEPVNAWIRSCDVAWVEFNSARDAKQFERDLHNEWLPELGKR